MRRHLLIATALSFPVAACSPEVQDMPPVDEVPPTTEAPVEPAAPAEERTVEITDEGPDTHLTYLPADVEWGEGPASLEPGAEMAVLEGDPGEEGVFTMRLRLPDGYRIAPHTHPNVERVTTLSGTFRLGTGDVLDTEAADRLETGSYTAIPPGMSHYAFAEGETVIQLTSVGPWELEYVNPDDDPRQRTGG